MRRVGSTYLTGALCGLVAASIWAGWSAVTRLAVMTALDAWDVAAMRFGVSGLLLLPVLAQRGLATDRLGWSGLAILLTGAGVPYVMLAAGGLSFAPARDQGALNPGVMPLFVALIAAAVLHERSCATQRLGLPLVLVGALLIVGSHAADWNLGRILGQSMFLAASLLWACFTVVMRKARLDPLHATALVSAGSAILYLPPYLALRGSGLMQLPIAEIVLHAAFQGILVAVASLILYGRAVAVLGASGGAAFGALVPAMSALIAIPLLGEWPSGADWIGIVLISAGVYFTGRRQAKA